MPKQKNNDFQPTFLILCRKEASGQLHTLPALTLVAECLVCIWQEADWTSQPFWMWWKRDVLSVLGVEPSSCSP
jgi:hypothetical protein